MFGLLIGLFSLITKPGFAQSEMKTTGVNSGSLGIYLTVSMALLLTGLTLLAISLLARYIKSIQGDSYDSLEDSES